MMRKVGILPDNQENPETRNLNFVINDGTDAIQGATVTIGEISGTTGSQGGCTLHNVTDGEHSVTIVKEGYTTKTETITVSESNTSFTFSLEG